MKVKTKEQMHEIVNSCRIVLDQLAKMINKEEVKLMKANYPTTMMTTNNFIKGQLKTGVIPRTIRGGRRTLK